MFPRPSLLGPRDLTVVAAALCSAALIALTWLALSLPALSVEWRVQGDALAFRTGDDWQVATALRDAAGATLPLSATLAIEEPDFLPGWTEVNAFLAQQDALLATVTQGGAVLLLADGTTLPVTIGARHLGDLPWDFWMQLAFGLVALTVGFGVFAFRPRTLDTALLLVTALGYAAGIWSAALYSTRDLLMPADLLRAASTLNHGGALLFDCAMAAMLWHYPRPLGRLNVPLLCAVAWAVLWTLDTLQVVDSLSLGFYLWLLLVFLLALAFAVAQWRRAERDPVARAALQWLLLSFMIGSGTFVALQIVPRVLGVEVPIPQSVLAGAFLIVYLGLAAGISRYRLFHLERWWRVTWSWLLGGVLVLLVDALLLWQVEIGEDIALALAVAISGWLYFPVRQWLLWRLLRMEPASTQIGPGTVRALFDLSHADALEAHWPDLLNRVFRPLSLESIDADEPDTQDDGIRTGEHGLHLVVPSLVPGSVLRLSGCEHGTRLFRQEDIRVAQDLLGIARHAQQTIAARAQGAQLERNRIKRDLHDDMGARLLSILHGDNLAGIREEARAAIQDMRQMLTTLDDQPVMLDEAIELFTSEARERCQREGVTLAEDISLAAPAQLNARQFANLKRIVREGVTNALKHAGGTQITITLHEHAEDVELVIADNGDFREDDIHRQGRGHHIVRARVEELGGHVNWSRNADGGCLLRAVIPRDMPAAREPPGIP